MRSRLFLCAMCYNRMSVPRYQKNRNTLNCAWGSAINIDDVQRIVLGDLVLWEAK